MEILSFSIAILVLVVTISVVLLKNGSSVKGRLPPGSLGLPIIGETLDFLYISKPENFVLKRMKKYSPDIFRTRIFGEKTAVICGKDGHKFIFSNENKLFSVGLPYSTRKLFMENENVKSSAPVEAPTEQDDKIIHGPAFLRPEALVYYMGSMDSIVQEHLKTHWDGKKEVEAYHLTRIITLTMASRFFIGIDNPERVVRLVKHFDAATLGLHTLTIDLPGTTFYKAKKATAMIRKELLEVIKEKRVAIEGGTPLLDILAHMIVAKDDSGKPIMDEVVIADKMMGLLVAGYSTLANAMAFFMKFVGENPDIYQKILSEQLEVAKGKTGEILTWDDMNKMKYSWGVIFEVMRLAPPTQGTFRVALTDIKYAGYTIPKGWKIYWTVSSTHKNKKYFKDPEKFDPSRYVSGEALPPYSFIPFGGGPRTCPGKEYARVAILTFIHNVVMKFKWELVFPNEKNVGDFMPFPEKGILIRLHKRS